MPRRQRPISSSNNKSFPVTTYARSSDTIAFLVGIDAISEAYDIGDYANGSYYAN